MAWWPDHSQESGAHEDLYDYRMHPEEDQRVRSMNLPLGAYNTETSAAVGLELNGKDQTGGAVGGGGQNSQRFSSVLGA